MKNQIFIAIAFVMLLVRASYSMAGDHISGDELRAALKSKNPKVRTRAAEKLKDYDLGNDPAMITAVLQALKDDDEDVRRLAADSLSKLKRTKHAKSVVPALTKVASNDENSKVRERALNTLACFEGDAKEAIPALVESLSAKNPQYRERALGVLFQIDPTDKACIQSFLKFAKDSDVDVRGTALNGLYFAVRNGADKKVIVPVIAGALKDKVPGIRASAARSLGFLGTASVKFIPVLQGMAKGDENEFTRKDASEAVRLIRKAMEEQTTQ
jgi:HEAT repeat protein